MIVKPMWLLPLLCLVGLQPPSKDQAKKDLERIQGVWVMHALEVNGTDVAPGRLKDTFLTMKGDSYQTKVKGKEQQGFRIKLDPSKDPHEIDMIQAEPGGAEKTYKGIYTIENDVFKMCRGLTPDQARPNQFATWPDTNYFVVTWKKQPK